RRGAYDRARRRKILRLWQPFQTTPLNSDEMSGDDAHDVGLLHDQEFLAVQLDLGARPLAEQHAATGFHVDGNKLAALVTAARSNSDDLAFLRLFLSGIGNDDATFGLLFGTDAAHDHAVVQWTEFSLGHGLPRALARVSGNKKCGFVSSLALVRKEGQWLPGKYFL